MRGERKEESGRPLRRFGEDVLIAGVSVRGLTESAARAGISSPQSMGSMISICKRSRPTCARVIRTVRLRLRTRHVTSTRTWCVTYPT